MLISSESWLMPSHFQWGELAPAGDDPLQGKGGQAAATLPRLPNRLRTPALLLTDNKGAAGRGEARIPQDSRHSRNSADISAGTIPIGGNREYNSFFFDNTISKSIP